MMGYWADRGGAISDLEAARFGGVRSYLDRPGLVAYERRYVGNATAGFRSLEGIDIIRNPSRVVATEPGTSPASLHLYQGVVETALERLLVEIDPAAEPDVGADPTVSRSTYNVFAAAKQAQISAVVLDGTAESLNVLEGLAIPESAKANIARDLVGGYVVIVPERAIELGWNARNWLVAGIASGRQYAWHHARGAWPGPNGKGYPVEFRFSYCLGNVPR